MVGLLGLIWRPSCKTELSKEHEVSVSELREDEVFKFLGSLPANDSRQRLALEPRRIKRLLKKPTTTVADAFHIAEDLVMLKR